MRIINEIHQASHWNGIRFENYHLHALTRAHGLKQWKDNKWKQCLRPHCEPSYKSHFSRIFGSQLYDWSWKIKLIECTKNCLKGCNSFWVCFFLSLFSLLLFIRSFVFFLRFLFCFIAFPFLIPEVNYNCIERRWYSRFCACTKHNGNQ